MSGAASWVRRWWLADWMRAVWFFLALGLAAAEAAGAASTAPATLRVDYFHTGGMGTELLSLDRVVVEPLPWPGNPAGDVGPENVGSYRYQVTDEQGKLLFRRGFGSIFGEWQTTDEASKLERTFGESVRFPRPVGKVTLTIDKRDGASWRQLWRIAIDPADMFVDTAQPRRQQPIALEQHGDSADHLDLLLLGDGYTADECRARFGADAHRMMEALFAQEPFHSRRGDFNVWGICPPATASGVSRPSTGKHVDNPVGAAYDAFGSERYLLTFDNRSLREIAAWASYDHVAILANEETYGGGGIFNLYATVAVKNEWATYVFVHELAHELAGLADEYYTSPVAYQAPQQVSEPWEPNVTADPEHPKWAALLTPGVGLPTPWPKEEYEARERDIQARRKELRAQKRPESEMSALFREEQAMATKLLGGSADARKVGAFQGANYDAEAFYRPQVDCIMFTRDQVPFCQVCQHALGAIIDQSAPHR